MAHRTLSVMLAVAVAATCATASAGLVVSSVGRNVRAQVNFEPLDENPSSVPGAYAETAQSTSAVLGAYNASATQTSLTPATMGPSTTGVGHADASVAPAFGGFSVFAESFMEVTFAVDANGLYAFTADATWTGTLPLTGSASVELKDATNLVLGNVLRTNAAQGFQSTSLLVGLTTGMSYTLTARALVERGGVQVVDATALADWNFNLAPAAVPEVSSMAMMGLATLAAGAFAWRRRGA
jgi:hypothetical protein